MKTEYNNNYGKDYMTDQLNRIDVRLSHDIKIKFVDFNGNQTNYLNIDKNTFYKLVKILKNK